MLKLFPEKVTLKCQFPLLSPLLLKAGVSTLLRRPERKEKAPVPTKPRGQIGDHVPVQLHLQTQAICLQARVCLHLFPGEGFQREGQEGSTLKFPNLKVPNLKVLKSTSVCGVSRNTNKGLRPSLGAGMLCYLPGSP